MGMTRQTAVARAACLMVELKAKREDEGEDKLDKRFAIANQLQVGGWVLEINGDGAVFSSCFGGVAHVSPLSHQAS